MICSFSMMVQYMFPPANKTFKTLTHNLDYSYTIKKIISVSDEASFIVSLFQMSSLLPNLTVK